MSLFLIILDFTIIAVVFVAFVWALGKRISDKEKEDFEKRDY